MYDFGTTNYSSVSLKSRNIVIRSSIFFGELPESCIKSEFMCERS